MVVCIMYMYINAGYKWNVKSPRLHLRLLDQPREARRANDVTGTRAYTFVFHSSPGPRNAVSNRVVMLISLHSFHAHDVAGAHRSKDRGQIEPRAV